MSMKGFTNREKPIFCIANFKSLLCLFYSVKLNKTGQDIKGTLCLSNKGKMESLKYILIFWQFFKGTNVSKSAALQKCLICHRAPIDRIGIIFLEITNINIIKVNISKPAISDQKFTFVLQKGNELGVRKGIFTS